MRFIVLINLLMMLIPTIGLTETATTGNLLPNAGTGQTSVQHSNSTIDGINSSTGFTLNNITDYSSSYNELEANGTGTVSATGTLLNISAGDHTTTADSLDGGVTLTSKTEVQNCEWTGSSHRCGQATSGQDSYSTTVTILDADENVIEGVFHLSRKSLKIKVSHVMMMHAQQNLTSSILFLLFLVILLLEFTM